MQVNQEGALVAPFLLFKLLNFTQNKH